VLASGYREVLIELGQRVRTARLEAGLTQEDAAAAAELDWRRWQRIEEGTVNATIKTLVRVARAVRKDFWSLLASETTGVAAPSRKPSRKRR
jgi:transcriptional regulator with XRE-family HTH domain